MRMPRLLFAALGAVVLTGALAGCNTDDFAPITQTAPAHEEAAKGDDGGTDADAADEAATAQATDPLDGITADSSVVAVTRTAGELWLLAGGQLAGVTDDALDLPDLADQDVTSLGAADEVDADAVLDCKPDLVIVSSEFAGLTQLQHALTRAQVPVLVAEVHSFGEYAATMEQLTEATGRDDLYERNVERVRGQVEDVIANAARENRGSFVAIEVSEDGQVALGSASFVSVMLVDLGLSNAGRAGVITLDKLCATDPDWVFVVYQGNEGVAQMAFAKEFQSQDAWQDLAAAQQGRVVMLPRALFGSQPNAKWGEAYAYLSQVLHGAWA